MEKYPKISSSTTNFERNFENAVDRAFETNSPTVLMNSSRHHASYLMKRLIDKATKDQVEIRIISGALKYEVYNQKGMITSLQNFLSSAGKVSVITEKAIDQGNNNQFAQLIKSKDACKITNVGVEQLALDTVTAAPHFFLVGDRAFRLETNHATSSAYGCFNNSTIGQRLVETFDVICGKYC